MVVPQGQWKNRFDPENVYQSDFQLSERRSCSVPTMFQEGRFRYASYPQDQVQVLELPYQGDRLSMVLVLPGPSTTLAQVEEGLHLARLDQWLSGLQESTVALHLPRFKMQDALSLKGALQSMGLTDLFDPDQASLPGRVCVCVGGGRGGTVGGWGVEDHRLLRSQLSDQTSTEGRKAEDPCGPGRRLMSFSRDHQHLSRTL